MRRRLLPSYRRDGRLTRVGCAGVGHQDPVPPHPDLLALPETTELATLPRPQRYAAVVILQAAITRGRPAKKMTSFGWDSIGPIVHAAWDSRDLDTRVTS